MFEIRRDGMVYCEDEVSDLQKMLYVSGESEFASIECDTEQSRPQDLVEYSGN
jgi:hypothetical protein